MNAVKLSTSHTRQIPSLVLKSLQFAQPKSSFSPQNPSFLASNLIKSYFEKGLINEARNLFDEMPERDVVAWTTMISGYTHCNNDSLAWGTFYEMLRNGVRPNEFTFSSVLKGCKGMKSGVCGCLVHGLVVKYGLLGSVYVGNALMDVYATCCNSMDEACMVFGGIDMKTGVSWTTLIAGYTHRGDGYGALRAFQQMLFEKAEQSAFSLSIAVKASALTGANSHGKQLHATILKYGLNYSLPVMNSIVDMYCWCQCLFEARQCFDEMPHRDLITWNTLIAGYRRSNSTECLSVFTSMESQGFTPNCFTLTSIIAACADLSLLAFGQQLHAKTLKRGFDKNLEIGNSFIDMYAKCGCICDSRKFFGSLSHKNLISWTSMMIAYGVHGHGKETVQLFNEMVKSSIQPDKVVFMAVLSACSHSGLVNEGLKYFNSMITEYKIVPDQGIYGCVVDLLARAGKVDAAYEMIRNMPVDPDNSVWGALLGSCRAHKLPILDKLTAQLIVEARPDMARTYLLLSNLYASEGEWREFARMRNLMKELGGRKEPGCSWIELKDEVSSFVVGDKVGPCMEKIYEVLSMMSLHMEFIGYAYDVDCSLHDTEIAT